MKFVELLKITSPKPLSELKEDQIKELQKALSNLGYPVGAIDGLIGPKTRTAWAEFKTDIFEGNPEFIGPESINQLQGMLKTDTSTGIIHDFSTKQGTIDAIRWECQSQGIGLKTQMAYVLATVEWETAKTFKPVREAYWLSENWRKKNLKYYPYYGRGYVQLTWKNNYQKYSDLLGVDMVKTPDLAMDNNIALFILVHGFKTGTFTGRKITDYISLSKTDFLHCRRCINGMDQAAKIAALAQKYL
ncbi:MAG TPA: glycoside hydrolase family 19 protein [Pyrinomonadaceae bacterium]|nr:glycoside hydrolase family 19 protein [Pyrinomonadaceae bacterium]